jgi:hypothetical protein
MIVTAIFFIATFSLYSNRIIAASRIINNRVSIEDFSLIERYLWLSLLFASHPDLYADGDAGEYL